MAGAGTDFLKETSEGLELRLRVTPRGGTDRVEGPLTLADASTVLAVRVRAPADKGAANKAVEKTLARWLGVPASSVAVARGTAARLKTVTVAGKGPELRAAALAALGTPED